MNRKPRGATLVEVLVTLLLVAMVLGMVGSLCGSYADVLRFASRKDQALEGAQDGLERMASELLTAVAVVTPSGQGVPSSRLEFQKVDPTDTNRLPPVLPTPLPSSWDPRDPSYLITVVYEVEEEVLTRTTTFPSGAVYTLPVASGVAGFSAEDLGGGAYALTTSFTSATVGGKTSGVAVTRLRTVVAPRGLQ